MGIKDLEDLNKLSMLRSQIDGISVEEILIADFPTVGSEDRVADALSKMRRTGFQELPVVDDGVYAGMISFGSILKKKNLVMDSKIKNMMRVLPTVTAETGLTKIAEHMISTNSRQLAVLNGKKVVGLVSRTGLTEVAARIKALKEIKVWEIMTTPVESLKVDAMLQSALEIMGRLDIKTVPIMDHADRLVGIVGMSEIIDSFWRDDVKTLGDMDKSNKTQVTVESVCKTAVHTIDWDDDIGAAAALMRDEHISTLPVMDDGDVIGILTEYDVIGLISACRDRETVFVQISGLEEDDKIHMDAMYADIEDEMRKISKIYKPESLNIHVTRYNEDGDRKKYSLSAKLFVDGMTVNAKVVDWDLVKANNDVVKRIGSHVTGIKDTRVRFRQRKR
ncbi:MAG: CBS domain-containing protein [Euryarchaeota archaeon]|nr:CBS domain-containing protein [Euryarchaeota archaeon]